MEYFRFWTVARKYAFANTYMEIKEEMVEKTRTVGSLKVKAS